MKLEKLYTLSQFVDLRKSIEFKPHKKYSVDEFMIHNLGLIYRYNEFLKQSLKKEMFINELEKPVDFNRPEQINDYYIAQVEAWEAAEKKVIFKDNQFEGMSNYEFVNPKTKKPFRQIAMENFKTIGELGDYYEGGLELKNVEL